MKNLLLLFVTIFVFSGCTPYDEFDENDDWTIDETDQGDTGFDDEDNSEEGSLTLYQVTDNHIAKIKDFPVDGNLLSYQQDYAMHQKMWDYVVKLIPLSARDKIAQFEVFYGGDDLAGYVVQIDENDLSKWKFALAIDLAGDLETIDFESEFTYVSIHEYGHVLTLNNDQVTTGEEFDCPQFFTGEGCSNRNSYINRLFELGWTDIYDELDDNNPDALYNSYPDRFVSDYAATNPGEDIAEVFTTFVIQERPQGNSIADQKVQLMYEFPELVELRREIRANGDLPGLRSGRITNLPKTNRIKMFGHKGCKH